MANSRIFATIPFFLIPPLDEFIGARGIFGQESAQRVRIAVSDSFVHVHADLAWQNLPAEAFLLLGPEPLLLVFRRARESRAHRHRSPLVGRLPRRLRRVYSYVVPNNAPAIV